MRIRRSWRSRHYFASVAAAVLLTSGAWGAAVVVATLPSKAPDATLDGVLDANYFRNVRGDNHATCEASAAFLHSAPSCQRAALDEALEALRQRFPCCWFVRLRVLDADGLVVVQISGTPRDVEIEPETFFN